jgi:hypothetical protein
MWTSVVESRKFGYRVRKNKLVWVAERFAYGMWHTVFGGFGTKKDALMACFDQYQREYHGKP